MPRAKKDRVVDTIKKSITAVFSFLFEVVGKSYNHVSTLPDRYQWYLRRHNLTGPEFHQAVLITLASFAGIGVLFQFWGILLGASAGNPRWFRTLAVLGVFAFGLGWQFILQRCLVPVSRLAGYAVMGLSGFVTVVLLGGLAIQGWASGTPISPLWLTRGFIIFGFGASVILLIPFLVLKRLGDVLYALIFSRIRQVKYLLEQLQQVEAADAVEGIVTDLRKLIAPGGMSVMEKWFAAISLYTMVLWHFPHPLGFLGALTVGAAAATIILCLRRPFGIVGYAIPKALYAGAVALLIGHLTYYGLGLVLNDLPWVGQSWFHYAIKYGVAIPFTLYLFWRLFKTCRLKGEEQAIMEGKARKLPHTLRATAFDAEGKPISWERVDEPTQSTGGAAAGTAGATAGTGGSSLSGLGRGISWLAKAVLTLLIIAVLAVIAFLMWANGVDPNYWNGHGLASSALWVLALAGFVISVYLAFRNHSIKPVIAGLVVLMVVLLWGPSLTRTAAASRFPSWMVGYPSSPTAGLPAEVLPSKPLERPDFGAHTALVDQRLATLNADRLTAGKQPVPRNIALALIRHESDWDAGAVSGKGAKGLMQLMPSTASTYKVADPFDPAENIRGGTEFLADLYDEFGSWEKALAAYNLGPKELREAEQTGKAWPEETRNLVADVMERAGAPALVAPVSPAVPYTPPVTALARVNVGPDGTGTVSIPASILPFQSPEIVLPAGSYRITATGRVNTAADPNDGAHRWVGPSGWDELPLFLSGRPLLVPEANFMAAVAEVEEQGASPGLVAVGSGVKLTLPKPAKVRFSVNDTINEAPASYRDNVGSLTFQISRNS